MHGSHVEDYCGAPRGGLTTRCHGYIIGDKSDEGQDASLRVEMGNVGLHLMVIVNTLLSRHNVWGVIKNLRLYSAARRSPSLSPFPGEGNKKNDAA